MHHPVQVFEIPHLGKYGPPPAFQLQDNKDLEHAFSQYLYRLSV